MLGQTLLFDCHSLNESEYHQILQWCSPRRQRKARGFDFQMDRYMCAVSEVLIKLLGCRLLHLPVTAMTHFQIRKDRWGKPSLDYNNQRRFACSISHSTGLVLVGVANVEIDVDIQSTHKSLSNSLRVFNQAERRINALHPADSIVFWSMKEAASKLLGRGLLLNYHDLNFVPQTRDLYQCRHHHFYVKLDRALSPNYVMTFAFDQRPVLDFIKNIHKLTKNHLLKMLDLL